MYKYKYSLIISQYYHTIHCFIVKFPKDFHITLKHFIQDLEEYKRDSDNNKDINFGDIIYLNNSYISSRYNINDSGDIYIINSDSIDSLCQIVCNYNIEYYKRSRGYIRKQILEDVSNHHQYDAVRKIVNRYFDIL